MDVQLLEQIFDEHMLSGNLFSMAYLDGADSEDSSYLTMPLRGILALWLLLCAMAASMYYIEDQKNGLFIWWNTRVPIIRDFAYYLVIMIIPTIMVEIGLIVGGVFTNARREILAIVLYDAAVIILANILRLVVKKIKGVGIAMPVFILASAVFSPVFIDFKEARNIQTLIPGFHYLYSIHDLYFMRTLALYAFIELLVWLVLKIIIKGEKNEL